MATRRPRPQAGKLAGKSSGRILHQRQGDFEYVFGCLLQGEKSLTQRTLEMVKSEEFRKEFIASRSSESAVLLLHRILTGQTPAGPELVFEMSNYERLGIEAYVEYLTSISH